MNVYFATSQHIFFKGAGDKIKLKNCLLSSCLQKTVIFH